MIGLVLIGPGALAQTPDATCAALLDQARAQDRGYAWEALLSTATRAAACAPDDLVALALLTKAAEAAGDWSLQITTAARGEAVAGDGPIAQRFVLSQQRGRVLRALDEGDVDEAREALEAVRADASDDAEIDRWVRSRQAEIEALVAVGTGQPCTGVPSAPTPRRPRAFTIRATARAAAFDAWCAATRAAASRDAVGLAKVLTAAEQVPVPDAAEVLPRQLELLEALDARDTTTAKGLVHELERFDAYPGLDRWLDEVEPPSSGGQVGRAIGVVGGAAAIGGGALLLVGRSAVDNVLAEELCRESGDGVLCTPEGSDQLARGEAQQIAGTALIGVGAALAATGVVIELTSGPGGRGVSVQGAPRGVVLRLRW